jgi:hypothetical protein
MGIKVMKYARPHKAEEIGSGQTIDRQHHQSWKAASVDNEETPGNKECKRQ